MGNFKPIQNMLEQLRGSIQHLKEDIIGIILDTHHLWEICHQPLLVESQILNYCDLNLQLNLQLKDVWSSPIWHKTQVNRKKYNALPFKKN